MDQVDRLVDSVRVIEGWSTKVSQGCHQVTSRADDTRQPRPRCPASSPKIKLPLFAMLLFLKKFFWIVGCGWMSGFQLWFKKNYKIAQFWLVRYLICRWLQILPRMKLVWRSWVLCPTVGGETVAGYLGISDRWLGLSYHLTLLLSPKYLQKCGHRKKCPPGRAHCCSQRMKGPKGKELVGVFWTLW